MQDQIPHLDFGTVRERLLRRRREIADDTTTSADRRKPVELDQSRVGRLSRMDALQEHAMALETDRRRAIELQRIEAALDRIDQGEYGYCLSCGEPIAVKRLEVDPTTPICVRCARMN